MSTELSLKQHHTPNGFSDRLALAFTKSARFFADTFFARRYGHRAVVLETVAAVPGMVGGGRTGWAYSIGYIKALLRAVSAEKGARTQR